MLVVEAALPMAISYSSPNQNSQFRNHMGWATHTVTTMLSEHLKQVLAMCNAWAVYFSPWPEYTVGRRMQFKVFIQPRSLSAYYFHSMAQEVMYQGKVGFFRCFLAGVGSQKGQRWERNSQGVGLGCHQAGGQAEHFLSSLGGCSNVAVTTYWPCAFICCVPMLWHLGPYWPWRNCPSQG